MWVSGRSVVLPILLTGLGYGNAAGQTQADTLSIFRAVLESRIPAEGLRGPEGEVVSVCEVSSSEGFAVILDESSDTLPVDTLPDLTPHQRAMVIDILEQEYGLPLADGCSGWLDGSGRQGVRFQFSAPKFESADSVTIYSAASMGGLWGSGARCRWVREGGGPWRKESCPHWWISD